MRFLRLTIYLYLFTHVRSIYMYIICLCTNIAPGTLSTHRYIYIVKKAAIFSCRLTHAKNKFFLQSNARIHNKAVIRQHLPHITYISMTTYRGEGGGWCCCVLVRKKKYLRKYSSNLLVNKYAWIISLFFANI